MPNATSVDIKDHLVTEGVGTAGSGTGWRIFIGQEPTSPNTTITLYDTGGNNPNPKWLLEEPSVQIRVRADSFDYNAAYVKIQEIKDTLLGLQATTINTTLYVGMYQTSDIFFLKYDDNNRPIFTTNWRFVREPATSTGSNRLDLSG